MSKIVWAIALTPPAGAAPAQVAFATVGTDVDTGAAPRLSQVRTIAAQEVFSFTIHADQPNVPCAVKVLPLGWIGGGCPPTIHVVLNDFGTTELTEFKLPFRTAVADACKTLQCHLQGSGILVCSGQGVSFSVDLTSPINQSGVYFAFESLGSPATQVTVSFGDRTIASIKV